MTRTRVLLLAITAVLVVSLAGCYTVLRHPTGGDIMADSHDAYSGYRTCADCHADAAYYHPYYQYGSSHHRWNSYHGSPWWYDNDSWWYGDDYHHDDPGDPGPAPETGVRHLWGAGGWPTRGWGFGATSSPGSGTRTPPASPSQPQPSQPSTGQTQDSPKEQDKDDESDNDDGGLWKERKKGF